MCDHFSKILFLENFALLFLFFFFQRGLYEIRWISFKIRRKHACFIRNQFQKAINIQISLLAIDLD